MKQLINPPIQALLWLGGVGVLGLAIWSLLDLKLMDEGQGKADGVSVKIPDSKALDAPEMDHYPQMVKTPLFWEGRKALEPPKAEPVKQAAAVPADTTLPEGRLIGIVDLGSSLFAIMQNASGGSTHLREGDMWGAWKVSGIDPDRMVLNLGEERREIPLVADFAAPQESPQVAKAKEVQQVAKAKAVQAQRVPVVPPIPPPAPAAEAAPQTAGLPFPADTEKQPPPLSVKDALEARQRLMASRWGALSGEEQEPQQPPAVGKQ
jgi:hypothetical protein